VTFAAARPTSAAVLAALEIDVLAGFARLERDTDIFAILATTIAVISALGDGGAPGAVRPGHSAA
jgi:hypothetical protein